MNSRFQILAKSLQHELEVPLHMSTYTIQYWSTFLPLRPLVLRVEFRVTSSSATTAMAYSPEQMRDAFACFADYHLPAGEGSVSVKVEQHYVALSSNVPPDRTCAMDCLELASLVRAFGKNPKQEDLQKIVTQIDPSGDGNISFDQFMQAFDKERSGMISERDLATVMRTFGEPL
eukprot:2212675-Rhodomonas_salina.1